MSDNDSDEFDEIEVSFDTFKTALKNDIKNANQDHVNRAKIINNKLQKFVGRGSQDVVDYIVDPNRHGSIPEDPEWPSKLTKASFTKFSDKTSLDIKIIQLMDEHEVRERDEYIRNEVIGKYLMLLPRKVLTDFNDTVESTKNEIGNMTKDVYTYLESNENKQDEDFESSIDQSIQKIQQDFKETKQTINKEVKMTKVGIISNICTLFGSTIPTKEELESEEFVKEQFTDITNKVRTDIIKTKSQSIKVADEAKHRIYFALGSDDKNLFEHVKMKSQEDFGRIHNDMVNNIDKINDILSKTTKSVVNQTQSSFNTKMLLVSFQEKDDEVRNAMVVANDGLKDVKNSFSSSNQEMNQDVQQAKDLVHRKSVEFLDSITQSNSNLDQLNNLTNWPSIEVDAIKKSFEKKNFEMQDRVREIKKDINNKLKNGLTSANRRMSAEVDKDNNEDNASKILDNLKNSAIDAFNKTDEKFKNDVNSVKTQITNKLGMLHLDLNRNSNN